MEKRINLPSLILLLILLAIIGFVVGSFIGCGKVIAVEEAVLEGVEVVEDNEDNILTAITLLAQITHKVSDLHKHKFDKKVLQQAHSMLNDVHSFVDEHHQKLETRE